MVSPWQEGQCVGTSINIRTFTDISESSRAPEDATTFEFTRDLSGTKAHVCVIILPLVALQQEGPGSVELLAPVPALGSVEEWATAMGTEMETAAAVAAAEAQVPQWAQALR